MFVKLSKYFFLFMFFTILFKLFSTEVYYKGIENTFSLYDAFLSTGAKFVNSETYIWSYIDAQKHSSENILDFAQQLAIDLEITKSADFSNKTVSNSFTDKTDIIGTCAGDTSVCVSIQLNKDKLQKSNISINVINKAEYQDINDSAILLEEKFRKIGLNPKVNTCIIGCFDGKLDYEEMNRISKTILKDTKAKDIKSIYDNNLISISAYSPYIDNTIELEGTRLNMNIALRYNAYENKTYIWLATPVITIEY
ncbi:MAG: YwmB family TATA-box binding protein [Clostridiaceae bacterium]|nr:YwmB family TATA-box binding protein [Clostridiaceae bacterium]